MTELSQLSLYNQAIILFAALVLFTSFIMLAQARMLPLIFAFAWQGMLLAVVTALVALVSGHPHLYISAALTVVLKVFLIPWLLYRLAVKLNIHLEAEAIKYPSLLLLAGAGLATLGWWFIPFAYEVAAAPVIVCVLILLIGYGVANTANWNRPLLLALGRPNDPLIVAAITGAIELALIFLLVPAGGYLVAAAIFSAYLAISIIINVVRGLSILKHNAAAI